MTLIEIEGAFIRADQIAAITIREDSDSETTDLAVSLIGVNDDHTWEFETIGKAKAAQLKAVKAWQEAMR